MVDCCAEKTYAATTIADITADLERAFAKSNLSEDVMRFVTMAVEKKWLRIPS